MPYARVASACPIGSHIQPVSVEVDIHQGLPEFRIIGLPDKQIGEARQRIRAALRNCGFRFPLGRVTINLAPAHLPKRGTGLDLPMAAAILIAQGTLQPPLPGSWMAGEVSLDGLTRPFPAATAILRMAAREGVIGCVIPTGNLPEAQLVGSCPILVVDSLRDLLKLFNKK